MNIKGWQSLIMPAYSHTDNTHASSVLITMQTTTPLRLYMVIDKENKQKKRKIKVFFLKNTNTFCFKPAVNIKYTKLEKNV